MDGTLVWDGNCGFCARSIAFVMRRARPSIVAVPAAEAQAELVRLGCRHLADDTVIWIVGDKTWLRSSAAVRVLWRMEWGWPLVGCLLWLIPRPLRDAGYNWVARNRGALSKRLEKGKSKG